MVTSAGGSSGGAGRAERAFFERLNTLLIPYIKRGYGSPGVLPTGLVLLETVGRKSGRTFQVPVFAAQLADGLLLVGTVRRRSQWIRNLAAAQEVTFWLAGERRRARVYAARAAAAGRPEAQGLPWRPTLLLAAVNAAASSSVGGAFVMLRPLDPGSAAPGERGAQA